MKLHVLNSDSAGNCYLLEASDATLIIDIGVAWQQVKKALNFDLKKVCGAILTHEHMDHAKGAQDALKSGIDIYASLGTLEAAKITGRRANVLQEFQIHNIGPFTIMPFDVEHDAAQPFGFLIGHMECGNVLFATDTCYLKYSFADLHNVIIEANHSHKILLERRMSGELNKYLQERIFKSHMSLETCRSFLLKTDLSKVNNIVLIHLSDGNSDAKVFKEDISSATGKNVHIADKGLIIDFNKTPF